MKTTFLIFISSAIQNYDFPRINGFVHTTEFKDVLDHSGKPIGERYVYLGRELTTDEFNEAAATIFNPAFPGEGRTFQPLAIDPEAIAAREDARKLAQEQAQAAQDEADRLATEEALKAEEARIAELTAQHEKLKQEEADRRLARESMERVKQATLEADRKAAAEGKAVAPIARPGKVPKPAPAVVPDPEKPAADPVLDPDVNTNPLEGQGESTQQAEESAAPTYVLDGKNIMFDGQRVAGLFAPDNSLRIPSKHASHRAAIEAWLKTQTIA